MNPQSPFETEVADLLVETLNLEDVTPSEIEPEESLFEGDLALDSVDALELSLAISQKYGVQLKAEEEETQTAFTNLRSLCAFIENHKTG